ncbi:MAG: hypothetical protein JNL10_07350 [Verrucomicrobiales bacterium]|nr:hypothetical protein [Verrucomicrobiales bacterium]
MKDQDVILNVENVTTAADGAVEISGRAAGDADSSVVLVVNGDQFSGIAHLSGLGHFQWLPGSRGETELTRVPECRPGYCATPDAPTVPNAAESRGGISRHEPVNGIWDPKTEPTVVDILLLYSNTALAAEGNEESLRQRILRAIENTNIRFTNSLVGVRLNPVFVGPLAWNESGSILTDWETFQFDSRVLTLRNNFKADLVYLFVEGETLGAGGVAPMPPAGGNSDQAFSVLTRNMLFGRPWDSFTDNSAFAHETGHMFGAQHDYLNTFDANGNPSPGTYNYSYGYRFDADEFTYTTIMAFEPGIPVPFFSNPNLTFQGVPLGITNSSPVPTDNAQTLNRLAPYVARYRTAISRVGFTLGRTSVKESDRTVTLGLIREGDLDSATRVTVGFDSTSSAKPDLDYTRPANLTVAFATNQATAELTFSILQDDLVEGDETLRITLGGIQGNHGLGEWGSTIVTIRDDEASVVTGGAEVILFENSSEAEITFEFTGALADGETRVLPVESGRDGDSATAGTDVVVEPSQVTFSETGRRQTIRVRSLSDALEEADETLQIAVGNAVARVRVVDDDRAGRLLPVAEADDTVSVLRVLPSGNVLVGGDFTTLDGTSRLGLAEIRPDGTVDPGFTPPEFRASPVSGRGLPPARVIAVVPDRKGRWLVGGYLGQADGERAGNLVRLGSDGRLDHAFKSPRFNGGVWNILEQADGRILVAGVFSKVGSRDARGLARLQEDGSWDDTFQATPGFEGWNVRASSLASLPDGRVLLGGLLEKYNGTTLRNIVRLFPDGSLDPSFPIIRSGTSGAINTIATLPDGRAYIGGFFGTVGGRPARRLARLKADGSVDPSFVSPNPNAEVNCLTPLPNGQLLVGGAFSRLANTPRRFVALLNADGTIDPSFDLGSGAGDHVWAMAASGDGSLYLGGAFRSFNHQPAQRLARLRLPSIAGAFHAPVSDPGGTFSSRVLGLPGAVYAVESSVNLEDWLPAGEVRIESRDNSALFSVPNTTDASYFRLKSPNP